MLLNTGRSRPLLLSCRRPAPKPRKQKAKKAKKASDSDSDAEAAAAAYAAALRSPTTRRKGKGTRGGGALGDTADAEVPLSQQEPDPLVGGALGGRGAGESEAQCGSGGAARCRRCPLAFLHAATARPHLSAPLSPPRLLFLPSLAPQEYLRADLGRMMEVQSGGELPELLRPFFEGPG